MFPEGTRSRGRGLLPFKTGAFHAAIAAGVPIVPICVSSTNGIKLNRWSNGKVIIEMLPPIDTSGYTKERVRELSEHCRNLMLAKIEQLDAEVAQQSVAKKIMYLFCGAGYRGPARRLYLSPQILDVDLSDSGRERFAVLQRYSQSGKILQ